MFRVQCLREFGFGLVASNTFRTPTYLRKWSPFSEAEPCTRRLPTVYPQQCFPAGRAHPTKDLQRCRVFIFPRGVASSIRGLQVSPLGVVVSPSKIQSINDVIFEPSPSGGIVTVDTNLGTASHVELGHIMEDVISRIFHLRRRFGLRARILLSAKWMSPIPVGKLQFVGQVPPGSGSSFGIGLLSIAGCASEGDLIRHAFRSFHEQLNTLTATSLFCMWQ